MRHMCRRIITVNHYHILFSHFIPLLWKVFLILTLSTGKNKWDKISIHADFVP
jgi:hypothetical protein